MPITHEQLKQITERPIGSVAFGLLGIQQEKEVRDGQ